MHDAQLEVNELPGILFEWIQTNVGKDNEEGKRGLVLFLLVLFCCIDIFQ